MKKLAGIIALLALLSSGYLYTERVRVLEYLRSLSREDIPIAVTFEEARGKEPAPTRTPVVIKITPPAKSKPSVNQEAPKAEPKNIPEALNLAVPFTPQAPQANWGQPYQDACEEASVAMVHYFYSKKSFTPEIADREILDLVAFEKRTLGFDRDTTAEQTAEFTKNYYGYKTVEVVLNPTVETIKERLVKGYPVIVPVYGRALRNPYFTPPGPTYHMLVIKGYTKDKFITNDPGTRRGADYLYSFDVLMNAVHDFNNGDVENGRKVMIVIWP